MDAESPAWSARIVARKSERKVVGHEELEQSGLVVEPEGAEPVVGASLDCWPFKVASCNRSKMRCWLDGSGAVGAGSQDCMIWASSLAICWVASFC